MSLFFIILLCALLIVWCFCFPTVMNKEKYEQQKKKNIEIRKQVQAQYDNSKKEFFKYAKIIDDIVNDSQKLATEESWNSLTQGGKFYEQALTEIKAMYEEAVRIKEDYNKLVNDMCQVDTSQPDEAAALLNDIKEKFEKYYVFDCDPNISFVQSLRHIIDELEGKQDMYELKQKRGLECEQPSMLEEIFLFESKRILRNCERMIDEAKKSETEKKMFEEIANLRNEQLQQRQQFNNLFTPKKGFIESIFDAQN